MSTAMTAPAPPASTSEALGMLTSAMSYLAAADATQMPAAEQAQCLATLERLDGMETAARALILTAFTSSLGYREDGDYSPRSWLMHQTRVTLGTANGHVGWSRRGRLHPRVLAALAAGDLSESYARMICGWTSRLPGNCQDDADDILVTAAQAGISTASEKATCAATWSRMVRNGKSAPHSPPVGDAEAGPVEPWQPPIMFGATTNHSSVSIDRPGPTMSSHQPAVGCPDPASPAR